MSVVDRAKIVIACLALFIAGCAVNQDEEVATYRKVVDFPSTTQPTRQADTPLTLREALWLSNQQNESLSIEGENYLQALIQRQRAVAGFLPTIDLAPSYFRRDASSSSGTGGQSQTHGLDVSVVGNINLFNGFRDVAALRATDLTIEQRRALLLDAQEALLADVVRVFFRVLRDEELTRVLENSLKVQDERVRDMRGRAGAGVARPLDVAQSEAQASETRVTLIDARNAVRTDRETLAFLTAAPVRDTPLSDDYLLPGMDLSIATLLEQAKAQRQDYLAALQGTLAARETVNVAWREYYPSVSLNLEGFLYRETIPDDRAWEGLLTARIPLFAAGQIHANLRTAWSRFRQARLFEQNLLRQLERDLRIAHENYILSGARLDELQTQVAAAQQAFEQADASYNAGLATNLERVVAQDRLLNAQLDQAGEQFNRKIAYLDLLRAVGALREEIQSRAATQPTTQPKTR